MKNLDQSLSGSAMLDESMSNLLGSDLKIGDLFSTEAIHGGLLYGPIGALTEANKKAKEKQKALAAAEGAQKEIAAAELESANAQLQEAQAALDLARANQGSNQNVSKLGTGDVLAKPTNWLLIGGITTGIIALGLTAFFVFRPKKG